MSMSMSREPLAQPAKRRPQANELENSFYIMPSAVAAAFAATVMKMPCQSTAVSRKFMPA